MIRRATVFLCAVALMVSACSSEQAKREHFENAERLRAEGKLRDAIVELRNAVALDDQWGEARFALADAYAAAGEPERALREYVRAADLMPDNSRAQVEAVTYLLLAGQFDDARTRAQRLLAREPANVQAQILLGNALAGLQNLDGAIAQIHEAIELEPARSQSFMSLALLQVAQGDQEAAEAAFLKAVELDPMSVPARLALANYQWSAGQLQEAEASFRQAFEMDPDRPVTNRALATLYIATGRPDAAERHLRAAFEATAHTGDGFALADHYIRTRQYDAARQVLEPLATGSTVSAAETRLAGLAYAAGETAEARLILRRVLERDPNDATALLMDARWLLNDGRAEEALARATASVNVNPRWSVAQYVRGLAEMATRRPNEAIRSFNQVLQLNPRASVAHVQISRLYLEQNKIDSAVLYAEQALAESPGSVDARLSLVRAWLVRGDMARAERGTAQLREAYPSDPAVHVVQGSLHVMRKETALARASFARALALDPDSLPALTGVTTIDMVEGRVSEARRRVEERLEARNRHPDLLLLAAKVRLADGDVPAAERALKQLIALDPLHTEAFTLLGRAYAATSRLDAARAEYERAAAAGDGDLPSAIMAAMIAHAQGDIEAAQARYEHVLSIEPRAALAANNLAIIFATKGLQLDRAQRLAESAIEHAPGEPEFHDTLGFVYYRKNLPKQAVQWFRQSVESDPSNFLYRYHLGLAHMESGDVDRAREELLSALELNPGFDEARHALDALN